MLARRTLLAALPLALAALLLGVGGRAGAANTTVTAKGVLPPLPPSMPAPTTITPVPTVGTSVPAYADIVWPDKTKETVAIGDVPAGVSGPQLINAAAPVVAARAQAEGRSVPPVTPAVAANGARRSARVQDDNIGYYVCAWGLTGPSKINSSTVLFSASIGCSAGVEETESQIYLFRGANYQYLIAWSPATGFPNQLNGTAGICAPSTWTYIGELDYSMYTPSGDTDFQHQASHLLSC